jgi:hypothetical protein
MIQSWLADAVLLWHLAFILFVVSGGFLLRRFPRLIWLHLPAAAWGALIEFAGWICPLTPLENHLRRLGGEAGYEGGFIAHYLLPVVYPEALSREIQVALGLGVIVVNLVTYAWWYRAGKRNAQRPD